MKILAIGGHLDDAELGAGATLAKLAEKEGNEIAYVGLSWCDNGTLSAECQRAIQILGFSDLNIYNFQVRRFNEARQGILDTFIAIREKFQPDMVFTHSSYSVHQDHRVVYQESVRAFNCEMLGYDDPWDNVMGSRMVCPSAITSDHLDKKLSALQQYTSQKDRAYFNPEFIKALAIVRGVQFKTPLAEAFEMIKTSI